MSDHTSPSGYQPNRDARAPAKDATAQAKAPYEKRWWSLAAAVVVTVALTAGCGASNSTKTADPLSNGKSNSHSTSHKAAAPKPKRVVRGKAVTLGAGTYQGGKDVAVGLYNVTAPGQSGNFIVTGTDTYDEILGAGDLGVPEVRVVIQKGDKIQLSGLSRVSFKPVKKPFVEKVKKITLYAGTWYVGEDIAPGRYKVTPGPGQSGNFIVMGDDTVDEILGNSSAGGVPSYGADLDDNDTITISGLSKVIFTPKK